MIGTYLAALCLIALNVRLAYVPLGWAQSWVAVGLSVATIFLVGRRYMHLAGAPALVRVFAVGALFWFAIMMALTGADYLTRQQAGALAYWP